MQSTDWIRGKNKIYDTSLNGGKGGYTKHATAKDIKYGENLRNSWPKGAEQFNKLVTSKTKISITFSKDDFGRGDMYGFGFAQMDKPGDVTSKVC